MQYTACMARSIFDWGLVIEFIPNFLISTYQYELIQHVFVGGELEAILVALQRPDLWKKTTTHVVRVLFRVSVLCSRCEVFAR